MLGEDLGPLSVKELQNLEKQLEAALAQARQRKVLLLLFTFLPTFSLPFLNYFFLKFPFLIFNFFKFYYPLQTQMMTEQMEDLRRKVKQIKV